MNAFLLEWMYLLGQGGHGDLPVLLADLLAQYDGVHQELGAVDMVRPFPGRPGRAAATRPQAIA
jgi:hypothetical protein